MAQNHILIDRIKGMIYGQCLGDAVGLTTEFKMKRDKPNIQFPYQESIRGFPVCDWTDDSDHMILVMRSLTQLGHLDTRDIALRLRDWAAHGFAELGDTVGMGLGGTTNLVLKHERFGENPSAAALDVWNRSGRRMAPNGSLMRTSILSSHPSQQHVEEMSATLSTMTHADPRCTASCVLYNDILWKIVHMDGTVPSGIDGILTSSIQTACKYIKKDIQPVDFPAERHQPTPNSYYDAQYKTREDEFAWYIKTGYTMELSALKLDEIGKIGFVLKCLGSTIWVLQVIKWSQINGQTPSFKKVIMRLAAECGDADTNCAVAGALLGGYLGYSKLPQDWLMAMPNIKWLDNIVNEYMAVLFGDANTPVAYDKARSPILADLADISQKISEVGFPTSDNAVVYSLE